MSGGLTGFSLVVRALVKDRAGRENQYTRCERCGVWQEYVELHHRRARQMSRNKRWDTNLASNSVALCRPCHSWCESNRTEALELGLLLKQFQTPTAVPVKLWDGEWFLTDDGLRVPAPETQEAS